VGRKLFCDKASINLHPDAFEMNPVVLQELRPVNADAVPVDQGRVGISVDAGRDYLIIWLLPTPWDLDVNENDDAPVRQIFHHGVELLSRERAVVADMNYNCIA
jgi:hypothetical protein